METMMDTPLARFKTILETTKAQLIEDLDEMIMTTDIINQRPNYLTVDEQGHYHVQASGSIDEVVMTLNKLLDKLERIKKYRDHN